MNSVVEIDMEKTQSLSQEWMEICPVSELLMNEGQCALVKGRQVALFRISDNDEIYAIDNHDPFSNANVISRGIVGDIRGRLVVASPIYKQHFELGSGRCLEDETVTLACYPARVVNGNVQLACRSQAVGVEPRCYTDARRGIPTR